MKRTQVQLRADQLKGLKRHAAENGISMAELVRDSIDYYVLHVLTPRSLGQQKKQALKVVGSFSSIAD